MLIISSDQYAYKFKISIYPNSMYDHHSLLLLIQHQWDKSQFTK